MADSETARVFHQAESILESIRSDRFPFREDTRGLARAYFKQAVEKKVVKQSEEIQMALVALYLAMRPLDVIPTLESFAGETNQSAKELRRAVRIYVAQGIIPSSPSDPRTHVRKFCKQLELPVDVCHKAAELINCAKRDGQLGGRRSKSIAAGALYLAAKEASGCFRSQKRIAEIAGVSVITVRQAIKLLSPDSGDHRPPARPVSD